MGRRSAPRRGGGWTVVGPPTPSAGCRRCGPVGAVVVAAVACVADDQVEDAYAGEVHVELLRGEAVDGAAVEQDLAVADNLEGGRAARRVDVADHVVDAHHTGQPRARLAEVVANERRGGDADTGRVRRPGELDRI